MLKSVHFKEFALDSSEVTNKIVDSVTNFYNRTPIRIFVKIMQPFLDFFLVSLQYYLVTAKNQIKFEFRGHETKIMTKSACLRIHHIVLNDA